MNRGVLALLLLVVALPAFSGVAVAAPLGGAGPLPTSLQGVSQAIPTPTCPTPPVNTTFGPVNCFTTLDLTEVFVILIGLTITFYVYMSADKAELPGEASEVPVTGEEELEMRIRKEQEERARAAFEGGPPP